MNTSVKDSKLKQSHKNKNQETKLLKQFRLLSKQQQQDILRIIQVLNKD